MTNTLTPAPGGLAAERLREQFRVLLNALNQAEFQRSVWQKGDPEPYGSVSEHTTVARRAVLAFYDETLAALDAATAALAEIIDGAPETDPGEGDWTTGEDAYQAGRDAQHYACAEIARRALTGAARTPAADVEARA